MTDQLFDMSFILSILGSFFGVLLILIVTIFYNYLAKERIKLQKNRIELEIFRKSYENDIYKTMEKLAANKARWEDVNHMIYDSSNRKIFNDGSENIFLRSLSINRKDIEVDESKAFLLAPMNPKFDRQIKTIKAACLDIGVRCETADEEFISGPILSIIIKKMLSANIVIAVIDGRNPNVFYELGLAHAFGKTVVMVSNGKEDIPFDIQSQRMVVVNWDRADSIDKIRKSIAESMRWARDLSFK